jgi:hypothetical protein
VANVFCAPSISGFEAYEGCLEIVDISAFVALVADGQLIDPEMSVKDAWKKICVGRAEYRDGPLDILRDPFGGNPLLKSEAFSNQREVRFVFDPAQPNLALPPRAVLKVPGLRQVVREREVG